MFAFQQVSTAVPPHPQVSLVSAGRRGHPFQGPHLDHLGNVALGPRVVRLVFHTDQHDEVQVVPHVVLKLDVLLK